MFSYNYNEDCGYIPIHLNAVFKSKYVSFSVDLIDDTLASETYGFIKKQTHKYIILDLSRIKSAHSRVFEEYNDLANDNKHLIFCYVDDTLKGHLLHTIKNVLVEGNVLFTSEDARNYFAQTLDAGERFDANLKKQIDGILANHLLSTAIAKDIFLDSSNIYSNMYVDIKQLFYEPVIYLLAVYRLCKLIIEVIDRDQFDGFICASNNGSVLATALSVLLNKKAIYLMNLGPHLTIMDREVIDNIQSSKRYIFIYDFICLGTELKLVKTIVTFKGAFIQGSFGVAKHHLPSRKQPQRKYDATLHALVSINDEYNFNYTVSIQ
jgi:orotate phosphoribosyltransferase